MMPNASSSLPIGHRPSRVLQAIAIAAFLVAGCGSEATAVVVNVSDAAGLRTAIDAASPGDEITLAPGLYDFSSTLLCDAPGTSAAPITVRAATLGDATIRLDGNFVLFSVRSPCWRFENLVLRGICPADDDCEHAIQLVGDSDFVEIVNVDVADFNLGLKANGLSGAFPDDVLVEGNTFHDASVRATANPVGHIEATGGRRWMETASRGS